MATIKDIAQVLGVSISTVSKGLNGAPDVSDALRHAILETAVELGYVNRRAKKPLNRTFAVFVENMRYEMPDDFGWDILMGFRKTAAKEEWGVDVIPVDPAFQREHHYDSFLMERKHSGAFLMGFSTDDPWMRELPGTSCPTVLLDNAVPANSLVSCIGTDSDEGIRLAIDHLTRLGHEKIAFLNGSAGSHISDVRMRSFLLGMSARHLAVDPDLAVYGYYVADAARYHVPGFLDAGATAILCGNDDIARGVIACCEEAGFSVPGDISVVGFDDLPPAASLTPALTTVRQPRTELGKCACYSLYTALNGIPLSTTELRPTLIVRESTGPAKPRVARKGERDHDSVSVVNPELYFRYARPHVL